VLTMAPSSQEDENAVTRHQTHNPVNVLSYSHYLLMFAQSQIPIRRFQHVLRQNKCAFRRVSTCCLPSPPKSGCWYLLPDLAPWLSFLLVVHAMCSNVYSLHARKCVCQSHAIFIREGAYSISTPPRTDTFRTICLHHQRKILSMGVYGVLYGDGHDPTANLSVCDVLWLWWGCGDVCQLYTHFHICSELILPLDTACSYLYSFNFSTWIDAEEASLMFRTCVLDVGTQTTTVPGWRAAAEW